MQKGHANVNSLWKLQGIQIPASLSKAVRKAIDVEMIRTKSNHGDLGDANDVDAFDLPAAFFDVTGGLDDLAGGVDVALTAVGDQGRPTSGNNASGP